MARPVDAPEWASDTNYPAGTDAWSATATKIEPTAGEKDTGATPLTGFGAQQFNWLLNNHGEWINHLDGINLGTEYLLNDDFNGSTFTNNWASVAVTAQVDDSAAGAFGCAQQAGGTGDLTGPILALGTKNFRLDVRVRVVTAGAGNGSVGLWIAGASKLSLRWVNSGTDWEYSINAGAYVATGTTWGATYRVLSIRVIDGTAYFYIDGTLEHSAAYATNLDGAYVRLYSAVAAGDVRFDYCKLWVDR